MLYLVGILEKSDANETIEEPRTLIATENEVVTLVRVAKYNNFKVVQVTLLDNGEYAKDYLATQEEDLEKGT